MKKILIFLALVAVISFGAFYASSIFAPKEAEREINFTKEGNIVVSDSGNWSLVYEEPGAPALVADLIFLNDSKCYEQNIEKSCLSMTLIEGSRVEIKGYKNTDNGIVEVKEMLFKDESISGLQEVSLYYYNPENDKDENSNIMCSKAGLVPVSAVLPADNIIFNTLSLLIQGNIPESAASLGVTTEYPLEGFSIESLSLENGLLTITFNDPNNATVGGSCRTGILWHQINETALQFDGVEEIRFQPEELFQP
ncbi:MAG: GerMN domain-containing protein [Candidatus Colwellbacteria bacterium]|nr:GerMN domain-containing protein [Candidatus Colwellbacteria bacterium]